MKPFLTALLCLLACVGSAQSHSHAIGRAIRFPDIAGYKTLKCDLHQHTVFSDGSVWPDIRVMEALMDSLDVISLTEHLEYQPHKDDIPHPNRNRSFELAKKEAKDHQLLIVHGSEITRRMPPGHCNAIFIKDANLLLVKDSLEVFQKAKEQGAFVFWNHPHWISQRRDGVATLTDFHRSLIAQKLLHGIEIVNEHTYSDEAFQIALDHNLTLMGTSDIHGLIDWEFGIPKGGHRPITLVLAKERNEEAIREALFNKKTVVYFKDMLIGRPAELMPIIEASIQIRQINYIGKSDVLRVQIENRSSMPFMLQNKSSYRLHTSGDLITLQPGNENFIEVKTLKRLNQLELSWEVLNAVTAPQTHPRHSMRINIPDTAAQ